MKKFFIFLITLVTFSASAQSLRFIYEGEIVGMNDTITIHLTYDDLDEVIQQPELAFVNQSTNDVTYLISLDELNICPNHSVMFCVSEQCVGTDGVVPVTVPAGETVQRALHLNMEASEVCETSVKVLATNQNDPTDVSSFYVHYDFLVGIEERVANHELKAYPNPAMDNVTIEYDATVADGLNLVIKNITGSEVYSHKISTTGKMTINVSNLNAGIYFYGLESADGKMICTKKLLVK